MKKKKKKHHDIDSIDGLGDFDEVFTPGEDDIDLENPPIETSKTSSIDDSPSRNANDDRDEDD